MSPAIAWAWVKEHRMIAACVAGSLAVLAVGSYARCHPDRVETRTVTDGKRDGTWGSTTAVKEAERTTTRRTVKKYDPGTGKLAEEVGEVIEEQADTASSTVAQGTEHETTRTETRTVVERSNPPWLGVQVQPMWDRLQLRPSDVTISADVPIGEVLGVRLRAGPAVRWKAGTTPDAYGAVLRAEF